MVGITVDQVRQGKTGEGPGNKSRKKTTTKQKRRGAQTRRKMATTFGYTKDELSQLMTLRKKDALDRLQEMGGTEAIVRGLQTNPTTGLSDSEAELEGRRTVYGRNHIESDPPKWFIALALDALSDKVLLILIGAAILEIVLGLTVSEHKDTAWVEGAAILVAVSVVVLVTAFNDWTKERQFRGLQTKLESTQRYAL